MPANLTPELLAQILALRNDGYGFNRSPTAVNPGSQYMSLSGAQGTPLNDYTLSGIAGVRQDGTGDAMQNVYDPSGTGEVIYGPAFGGGEFGNQGVNVYNASNGEWMGTNSGDGDGLTLAKLIAAAAATYAGGYGLEGAGGGTGAAAAGATEAGAGAGLAGGAAEGSALDALMAGGGYGGGTGATMTGGSALTSGAGSGVFGTTLGDAGLMSSSVGGYNFGGGGSTPPPSTGGRGMNLGSALGALAGAASSRDQTQSSNRDPWAPAQPFLRQQIAQGQQLAEQYQRQPFSQAQQTAYGNYGGLLDALNGSAGGLLGGMSANASGANNFDRSNPRRQLQSGGSVDLSRWMPGLLGNFGAGGR